MSAGAINFDGSRNFLLDKRWRVGFEPSTFEINLGVLVPAVKLGVAAFENGAGTIDLKNSHSGHAIAVKMRVHQSGLAPGIAQKKAQEIDVVGPLLEKAEVIRTPIFRQPFRAFVRRGWSGRGRLGKRNVGIAAVEPVSSKAVVAGKHETSAFAAGPPCVEMLLKK